MAQDIPKYVQQTVFLFFLTVFPGESVVFDPFMNSCRRIGGGGSKLVFIAFIGGGIPIGGGGGGTDPPRPRGNKSSLSSSGRRSVKSKSHKVNGRVIFFISSSQCSSFSDFFGSGFLISWSLLGDLNSKTETTSKNCQQHEMQKYSL